MARLLLCWVLNAFVRNFHLLHPFFEVHIFSGLLCLNICARSLCVHTQSLGERTLCLKKTSAFYFLNNSVKN